MPTTDYGLGTFAVLLLIFATPALFNLVNRRRRKS